MIEKSTKYATIVETLTEAWTFVMQHLDFVGPNPHIIITPLWRHTLEYGTDTDSGRHFEVAVSGMVELP